MTKLENWAIGALSVKAIFGIYLAVMTVYYYL